MRLIRDFKFFAKTSYPMIFTVTFVLLSTVTIVLTPTQSAYAWGLTDVFDKLNEFITAPLRLLINTLYSWCLNTTRTQDTVNLLTSDWNNLFGDSSASGIASFVQNVCNTVVKPVGFSILSFVMIVQFVKITTSCSSNDTFPAVREIIMFMIVIVILYSIISVSDQLFQAIFDIFNKIAKGIGSSGQEIATKELTTDETDLGKLLAMLVGFIPAWICSLICSAIVMVSCYARAIQLYVYSAFAPIPLSLIGIDETRSYGVGYIRNFAAVCLASCIMILILYFIPYLSTIIMGKVGDGNDIFMVAVNIIVLNLILAFSMVKAGSWAKEILGA